MIRAATDQSQLNAAAEGAVEMRRLTLTAAGCCNRISSAQLESNSVVKSMQLTPLMRL